MCDRQRQVSLYMHLVCQGFFYLSSDKHEAVEGTYNQQRLWSDCAYVQADLSLQCLHKSVCLLCAGSYVSVWLTWLSFANFYVYLFLICLVPTRGHWLYCVQHVFSIRSESQLIFCENGMFRVECAQSFSTGNVEHMQGAIFFTKCNQNCTRFINLKKTLSMGEWTYGIS